MERIHGAHIPSKEQFDALEFIPQLEGVKIINLTQHDRDPRQEEVGVIDLPDEQKAAMRQLITFEDRPPRAAEIEERAQALIQIVEDYKEEHNIEESVAVMLGGAPYFTPTLEKRMQEAGHLPVYAFTERESIDLPGGHKKSVFKHKGFFIKGRHEDPPPPQD